MSAPVEPTTSGHPDGAHERAAEPDAAAGQDAARGRPRATRAGQDAAAARRPHRTGRIVVRTLLVTVLVVVAAGCWLAFRAWQASTALLDARSVVKHVQAEAGTGGTAQVRAELPAAQASLDKARRATADPVWALAGHLPWIGDDLRAVRTTSVALDDLARSAIPAVNRIDDIAAAQREPGADGRIALGPIEAAAPDVHAAAVGAARADATLATIDTGRLLSPLASPVDEARDAVHKVARQLATGDQVITLVPAMLGADGPRSYLLVSLNSAELRTPGGIPGAFALLHANDGALDLTDQRSTIDLPHLATPVLPLTAEELTLHTDLLGRYVQDALLTPDFPRAAQLLVARWELAAGSKVDGVIATDPVAAKYLLDVIGAVHVKKGPTLTAGTLLPAVLHDSYLTTPDPAANDRFYAKVATAIFRAVGAGQGGDQRGVVDALGRAGSEGRLRIWSAHADEQRRLVGTTVGAAFLTGPHGDDAGVFLDDATAGKLDYYLTTRYSITDLRCTGADPGATVRVSLDYHPPANVTTFPEYVTGPHVVPVGDLATRVSVYAPQGAPRPELRVGDGFVSGVTGTANGRQVQSASSLLKPGGSAVYTFTVPVRNGAVDVWTTPTLTSPGHVHATCG
ncbi:DUF4012 domain-containing protein [Cellulomonas alba]|uniref:DUF4012 domain-containing protein n=1 Tax=Cellulomonas alba TaxID=3053467 RepID=A0ABT7SIS7_9CELL|nr:DUF4012 domain-containing protein [Cellulomonas alba]MDM7855467.1 DUF4012 domain-containing protein [Cellulomonas alba]